MLGTTTLSVLISLAYHITKDIRQLAEDDEQLFAIFDSMEVSLKGDYDGKSKNSPNA